MLEDIKLFFKLKLKELDSEKMSLEEKERKIKDINSFK